MTLFRPLRVRAALACALLLTLAGSAWAQPRTVRLRADQWMPYNGDPAAATPGYVVELARLIFGPRGIQVDYQTMPWTDALKAAGAGEIEGVIGANPPEAKGLVLPAEPIGLPRVGLFTKKSNKWHFSNVPALREVKLGAIEGYSYWDSLDDYIKKQTGSEVVRFKGETPLRDGIAKLDAGELDVMAETMAVWVWTVKDMGRSMSDYRVAYVHPAEPIFVAFATQNENGRKLAEIWDEGLRTLRANGKLAKLLEKYGVLDWK
jgi:polar amino acid transport system substrate-binding protein